LATTFLARYLTAQIFRDCRTKFQLRQGAKHDMVVSACHRMPRLIAKDASAGHCWSLGLPRPINIIRDLSQLALASCCGVAANMAALPPWVMTELAKRLCEVRFPPIATKQLSSDEVALAPNPEVAHFFDVDRPIRPAGSLVTF
jgi:hypothetical protein